MSNKNIFKKLSLNAIDRHDRHGLTRLYKAARHGNLKQVKTLLNKGADPNKTTKCGLSPLHIAAFWGEVKIVELLLASDAKPNVDNGRGWTPLHSASLNAGLQGRKDVIRVLVAHGADKGAKDKYGWAPSDYEDLWKDVNVQKLKNVMQHIKTSHNEYTGHQPNMDDLNLSKVDAQPDKKQPSKTQGPDTPHQRPKR